jgi:hypothetical protein
MLYYGIYYTNFLCWGSLPHAGVEQVVAHATAGITNQDREVLLHGLRSESIQHNGPSPYQ